MNEIANRKVIEHNDLITSVAKMDKVPLKIFELAVSCIDTENPPKDNTVYLSKRELFTFFDVKDNDKHRRFKEAIEKMQKQAFFEIRETEGKKLRFRSINPLPTVTWTDYDDKVEVEFNKHIMPYLVELRENFTQYAISDIMELNSKYSIILYKWLCMNFNQYEHYRYRGNRTPEQLASYKNPQISVAELRRITNTEEEYERFNNFEAWILKKPAEEISEKTHFHVRYEKIKKGRSIDAIQFFIDKNKIVADTPYKENDPVYLANKKEQEQQRNQLVVEAQQSPYTQMLLGQFLLGVKDILDMELMLSLQSKVYPLYEELEGYRGKAGVEIHISYVASKQEPYSKYNMAKYLYKSIESYIVKVKIQDA